MHDIKWIRENPEAFDAAMKRRGLESALSELLQLDETKREQQTKLQHLQAERNQKSKAIGAAKAKGENADVIMAEVAALKEQMATLEAALQTDYVSVKLQGAPNILASDVPDGKDETQNKELRRWGAPTTFAFEPKDHVALGEGLGMMDFESAAKMSGSRFVVLTGKLARLERALAQFMLDVHTGEHGYTEVNPPLLVRDNALFGTGQLPKFAMDLFKVGLNHHNIPSERKPELIKLLRTAQGPLAIDAQVVIEGIEGRGDYYLIPTSEVALTNIVADSIVPEESLPRRYTALTPCFRSEAGAAGKDTRGMIRQHQFSKVELVSITSPEESEKEHERMARCAETILERLQLPYRTMLLCAGDTGFGAQKTYDLEVWLPAQNTYREISSCSNCGPFQARRMKARFRPMGYDKGSEFVHTLNGSGVAVGRALVAVLENYQQADGSIRVPEVLQPYMGGITQITHEKAT